MEEVKILICPFMSHRDGSGVPWPCVRGECACWIAVRGNPLRPQNQGLGYCGLMHWYQ